MLRPCPNVVSCPGSDDPISNTSSEAPDGLDYLEYFFFGDGGVPPLFHDWSATACGKTFVSNTSQLDALLQAISAAIGCLDIDWTGGGGTPWPNPAVNQAQTCTRYCTDGLPFTYTFPAGLIPAINQATANEMAMAWACKIASENKICLSSIQRSCCLGEAYLSAVHISGPNPGPFSFVLWGSLPTGLTFSNGTIAGVATETGNFSFSVEAISADGSGQIRNYTIAVLDITPSTLANGSIGTAYSQQLTGAGGTGGYTFDIGGLGFFPAGLTLSAAGLISGTPTEAGAEIFEVTVTDSAGNSCTKIFTLTIQSVSGYKLCNLAQIIADSTTIDAAWPASVAPAWDGILNQTILTAGGSTVWYFTNGSFDGNAVAADEAPNYPNPGWQDTDCFMMLIWNGANWGFYLSSTVCASLYAVYQGVSTDPLDASGTFNLVFHGGGDPVPASIQIEKASSTVCCDTDTAWRTAPGNCALRVFGVDQFVVGQLANCAICNPGVGAQWDGTFDTFTNFGNPDLAQFEYSGGATQISGFDFVQKPKLAYSLAQNRWIMQIYCQGGGPAQVLWQGDGPIGTSPIGVYTHSGGCALVFPASLTVEAYNK